jgi:hypothetical protein
MRRVVCECARQDLPKPLPEANRPAHGRSGLWKRQPVVPRIRLLCPECLKGPRGRATARALTACGSACISPNASPSAPPVSKPTWLASTEHRAYSSGLQRGSAGWASPTRWRSEGAALTPSAARWNRTRAMRYGVALSLPSAVGRQGVVETFLPEMSDETRALERSAEILRGAVGKYLHKS